MDGNVGLPFSWFTELIQDELSNIHGPQRIGPTDLLIALTYHL